MPFRLTSPGWPDNYPNKAVCVYFIQAEPGYRVVVTFHHFDVQPDWDNLSYGDGRDVNNFVIRLSG